jgi:hypothetical protein
MSDTKAELDQQVNDANYLLVELGVDIGLSLEYAYGQPRLMADNGSRYMSFRQSKRELDKTLYAVKNILYEIGRIYRQQERGNE